MIIIELLAAQKLGLYRDDKNGILDKAIQYLLSIQIRNTGTLADGGFLGVNQRYAFDGITVNTRTSSYAVMALLKAAGDQSKIYAIED